MGANLNMTEWVCSSACLQGISHKRQGLPCQDCILISERAGMTIAVLSDGAGSETYSHIGANEICLHVSGLALASFDSLWGQNDSAIRNMILQSVLERLAVVSHDLALDMDRLAATLLFVAVKDDRYIAGNIGDGVIGAHVDGASRVLCTPKRGEFANETFFVTSADAISVFDIRMGLLDNITGFALMTDGVASCLYSMRTNVLAPAVSTVWQWLEKYPSEIVNRQISKTISELFQPRTQDDCSIAFLKRIHVPAAVPISGYQVDSSLLRTISLTFDNPDQLEEGHPI